MMDIEEVIKILDPETRREALRKIPVMERIETDQEACRVAVAALHAQQKNRGLDMTTWEPCGVCALYTVEEHRKYMEEHPEKSMRFCWNCGRPLTQEARAELEKKIGGNDEKTD